MRSTLKRVIILIKVALSNHSILLRGNSQAHINHLCMRSSTVAAGKWETSSSSTKWRTKVAEHPILVSLQIKHIVFFFSAFLCPKLGLKKIKMTQWKRTILFFPKVHLLYIISDYEFLLVHDLRSKITFMNCSCYTWRQIFLRIMTVKYCRGRACPCPHDLWVGNRKGCPYKIMIISNH